MSIRCCGNLKEEVPEGLTEEEVLDLGFEEYVVFQIKKRRFFRTRGVAYIRQADVKLLATWRNCKWVSVTKRQGHSCMWL